MNSIARKKIIQEYYSRRANDYDRQKRRTWTSSQGFADEITNEVAYASAFFENGFLLEVGVGTGRTALPLLGRLKLRFVGLDLSREMLRLARTKLSSFKHKFDLVLGDAEHLPFTDNVFDALICMSAMHYFESQEKILPRFSKMLKGKGFFVYGDLTLHELDDQGFFELLERTLTKTHPKYYKSSEVRKLLETCGFRILRMKTVAYKKSYHSLMEDKGDYFDVTPETLCRCVCGADATAKNQYALTDNELTLFYTVVTAQLEH